MSLNTMSKRLTLEIPGLSDIYAKTLLGEALKYIEDLQVWSFQIVQGGYLPPGLLFPGGSGVSLGTITATVGSTQVVGDATAAAAWVAYTGTPALTSFQIRSPFYSLYSIVAFDNASTLT